MEIKKEETLELYQQGEEKEIYKEKDKLRVFVMNSAVFTFKKHLIHLGVLSAENVFITNRWQIVKLKRIFGC